MGREGEEERVGEGEEGMEGEKGRRKGKGKKVPPPIFQTKFTPMGLAYFFMDLWSKVSR